MLLQLYPEVTNVDVAGNLRIALEDQGLWVTTSKYDVLVESRTDKTVLIRYFGTPVDLHYISATSELLDSGPVPSERARDQRILTAVDWLCSRGGWSVVKPPHPSRWKEGAIEVVFAMNGRGPRGNEDSETSAFFDGRRGYLRMAGIAARPDFPLDIEKDAERHRKHHREDVP
jgi:hypothetical protein